MKKNNIITIITYLIIILSYLSTTFYKYSGIFDALLAFGTNGFILIWLLKRNKDIDYKKLLIIYITLIIIIITQKLNLISITMIVLLNIICEYNYENINLKKYLKISIICFLVVVSVYFILGFNKKYDTSIWRVSSNMIEYRYSLGFNHPNQAMFKWFAIALGCFSIVNRKNIIKLSFLIGGLTLIIYHFTVSRTSFIAIYFVIGFMIIFRNRLQNNISSICKKILAFIPILFTVISFLSMKLVDFDYLNNIFSGRFVLYKKYFEISGINLFGNKFIENNAMLDNSYLHMLLSKGLIFFICYIILIYHIINKSKNITVAKAIIILSYFITGLVETILFKFDLLLLIILLLSEKREGDLKIYDKYRRKNT